MTYKGQVQNLYNENKYVDGDIVYAVDTEKYYLYTEKNGWLHLANFSENTLEKIQQPQYCSMEIVDDKSDNPTQLSTISLYELNKQIIFQMPDYTEEQINEAKNLINSYMVEQNNYFYMLLSNEMRYYTIFSVYNGTNVLETFPDEVIDCLNSIGPIKSIEKNTDGVIEIWCVPTSYCEEACVFYLFPYDQGVVLCQ